MIKSAGESLCPFISIKLTGPAAYHASVPIDETLGRPLARTAGDKDPYSRLGKCCEVPARPDWNYELGDVYSQKFSGRGIDAEAIRFARSILSDEFYAEANVRLIRKHGHTEQLPRVYDTQASDLYMVSDDFRGLAPDTFADTTHQYRVVGYESMPTANQVECAFRFTDAGLSTQQHADPKDLHQNSVYRESRRQFVPDDIGDAIYCLRTGHRRGKQR